jgi:hypothetical protein
MDVARYRRPIGHEEPPMPRLKNNITMFGQPTCAFVAESSRPGAQGPYRRARKRERDVRCCI